MRERLGLVAIAALVVVNMILIPLAFRNAQGSTDQKTVQVPATSPRPEEPESSAARTPPAKSNQQTRESAPLLMSSGGRIILTSPRGNCTDGPRPSVRLSTDRGRTFRTLKLNPRPTAVLALEVVDGESLLVIGADERCRPGGYESRDEGRSWEEVDVEGRWHLPGDPAQRQVASPNGQMDVPCRPTGLSSVRNDVARVLCPDGRILRTVDDESWTVTGSTPGAAAIRFPVPDVGFALAALRGCPATVLRSTNGGKKWERLTCLKGDDPRGISGQDGSYAAIVDDTVHVSEDRGETWRSR